MYIFEYIIALQTNNRIKDTVAGELIHISKNDIDLMGLRHVH